MSQSTELSTLTALGLSSISLASQVAGFADQDNWVARSATVSYADGSTKTAESVYFAVDTYLTNYVLPEGFVYADEAFILPDLKGFGDVRDLSIAISEDPQLLQELKTLVLSSNGITYEALRAQVEQLVYNWVEVDEKPHSGRGSYVDYDKLAVVEAFAGQSFWAAELSSSNAAAVEARYDSIIDGLTGRLTVQLSGSYYALNVVEEQNVAVFDHSLAAYEIFFYDAETDMIDGRLDLFLSFATSLLEGDAASQLDSLDALLSFASSVGLVLFNGDREAFEECLGNILKDQMNFSNVLETKDISLVLGRNVIVGTVLADLLAGTGTEGPDAVYGFAGDDTIRAGQGDDALIGGAGNDTLSGDGGNDTYIFNLGDGQDIVRDFGGLSLWGGNDTIEFGAGIAAADVTVTQADSGRDLVLSIAGTSDRITIDQTMISSDYRLESVRFADGTVWTHADMVTRSISANSGNDVFYGSYDGESLDGGAGNDTLYAHSGNDVLTGGTGNDTLSGDGGNDTYIFNLGDGQDIVREFSGLSLWGGFDVVQFGAGINPADVSVGKSGGGANYVLYVGDGSDSVTLASAATGASDYWIEEIRFADGTVWTRSSLEARVQLASNTADTLTGTTGGDILRGLQGDDSLSGLAGNDMLSGDAGSDTLLGGGGDDALFGGDGNDLLDGGADVDQLTGGQGSDIFRFGQGGSGLGSTADRLLDFVSGTDKIDFSTIDADVDAVEDQAFTFIGSAAFSGMSGELRLYNDGTDSWLKADVNGDGIADFEVMLAGAVTPLVSDFIL